MRTLRGVRLQLLLWVGLIAEAAALFFMRRPWIRGGTDSRSYLDIADGLRQGGFGRVIDGVFYPEAIRPLGYPFTLHVLLHVLTLPMAAVIILQLGLYLLAVYLISRTAARYDVDPKLVLVLALLCPYGAYHSAVIMTEAWAIVLVAATLAVLLAREIRLVHVLAAGVIAGIAVVFRPNLAWLPLLAALVTGFRYHGAALQRFAHALLLLAVAAATTAPVALHYWQTFHRLTVLPPAGGSGASLYHAAWAEDPTKREIYRLSRLRPPRTIPESPAYLMEAAEINRLLGAPPLTSPSSPEFYPPRQWFAVDSVARIYALRRIRAEPAAYAGHVVRNVFNLWMPADYPDPTPKVAEWVMRAVLALVWGLALLSTLLVRSAPRRSLARISSAFVFAFLASQVWFHTETRYSAPLLLPLLLAASAALVELAHERHGLITRTGWFARAARRPRPA